MSYEVTLVTDIQMSIEEKLTLDVEQKMAAALKQWIAPVFSGRAHDLDMSFFALDSTDILKHHKADVIDATQKSYTLNIPREDYMHLAVVNIADNEYVSLSGTQHSKTMCLEMRKRDTLPSQPTAVYTARLPMKMAQDTTIEKFDVRLYMVSCAVALVVDSLPESVRNMKAIVSGTATGFMVLDSVFTYDHPSIVRTEQLSRQCYAAVALPSKGKIKGTDLAKTKAVTQEEQTYWEVRTYVPLKDGTVTETKLSIQTPLEAGTIEIIRVNIKDNGSAEPLNRMQVGATVTLDWKEGGTHDIEI